MSKSQVFGCYRRLWRVVNSTFRDDIIALNSAREEMRQHFEKNRDETDPSKISKLLAEGEDAREFLKTSIVQARLNEQGNYTIKVDSPREDVVVQDPAEAAGRKGGE
uniref:Complex 1 LYR protein domain-containing protein n=1 Tax=Tetraselmis sp. GSL018 TaxID=582737 RepID=A0A061RCN5_9CHLO